MITSTWSSRIPDIQRQLHLSNAELGGVLFAISAGLVFGLPVSSWLVARYSAIKMMTVSTLIFAVIISLLAMAPNIYLLVILLFLFGALRNLVSMSANTNSLEVQNFHQKPIIATFHGIWSMACFVGIAIGALMISKGISPFWHFLGVGMMTVIVVLVFKRKQRKANLTSEKKAFFVKPDRYLFLLGLIAFCSMFCESCMFDWSINYYEKVIRADKDYVTFGYSSFIIMMTLGRLVGDRFIARFGSINILWFNGLLMAAGCIAVIIFPHVGVASVGFALIGLGSSVIVPIIYSMAGKSEKMSAGYAIASITMVGYVGFLSSPLVVGALSQKFGMQTAFGILIFISLMISVLAIGLKKGWWFERELTRVGDANRRDNF
ncbi:MAG: MFS transporter [Chitinophagaceae bacterium]|nr:MFS transporter [Chitinophagaceae bacterium]